MGEQQEGTQDPPDQPWIAYSLFCVCEKERNKRFFSPIKKHQLHWLPLTQWQTNTLMDTESDLKVKQTPVKAICSREGSSENTRLFRMTTLCLSGGCWEVWEPGLPGEEDALHDVEVLHKHVSLWLGAQVAHGVANAQLDGPLQGGRRGL